MNVDEKNSSSLVRFYHECFQPGQPELLHNIQRATKGSDKSSQPATSGAGFTGNAGAGASATPNSNELDDLKSEMEVIKEKMNTMGDEFDRKLAKMQAAIEMDYNRRINQLEATCQSFIHSLLMNPSRASSSTPVTTNAPSFSNLPSIQQHYRASSPQLIQATQAATVNLQVGGVGANKSKLGLEDGFLQKLPTATLASLLSASSTAGYR